MEHRKKPSIRTFQVFKSPVLTLPLMKRANSLLGWQYCSLQVWWFSKRLSLLKVGLLLSWLKIALFSSISCLSTLDQMNASRTLSRSYNHGGMLSSRAVMFSLRETSTMLTTNSRTCGIASYLPLVAMMSTLRYQHTSIKAVHLLLIDASSRIAMLLLQSHTPDYIQYRHMVTRSFPIPGILSIPITITPVKSTSALQELVRLLHREHDRLYSY